MKELPHIALWDTGHLQWVRGLGITGCGSVKKHLIDSVCGVCVFSDYKTENRQKSVCERIQRLRAKQVKTPPAFLPFIT